MCQLMHAGKHGQSDMNSAHDASVQTEIVTIWEMDDTLS